MYKNQCVIGNYKNWVAIVAIFVSKSFIIIIKINLKKKMPNIYNNAFLNIILLIRYYFFIIYLPFSSKFLAFYSYNEQSVLLSFLIRTELNFKNQNFLISHHIFNKILEN
ncbi:hypothetical protein H311_02030 [Anncaliia algerae PRA109]|nr:hypothetical protein H311_02030 [Anncaliia algerae PRA109]